MTPVLLLLLLLAAISVIAYHLGYREGHEQGHIHADEQSYGQPNEHIS